HSAKALNLSLIING
ncbi:MAG: hypothetical protein COU52_03705, partial [Candidatus Omnitrophica bacterium CG10_big_fil_rev_8_21_14_0_10_43_8]